MKTEIIPRKDTQRRSRSIDIPGNTHTKGRQVRPWLSILLLAVLSLAYQKYFFPWQSVPFEDAAILMRYSDNVAAGYGIVWNPGETPVDGATDFLFMVALAGLKVLGVSIPYGAAALITICHIATVAAIYARLSCRVQFPFAHLGALLVAFGPGLAIASAYFAAPVFGLFVVLSYGAFLDLVLKPPTFRVAAAYSVTSLVMALIRPEGCLFFAAMSLSLLVVLRSPGRESVLKAVLLLFMLPGAIYFLWRWSYFGHPLPNPFYLKGGGTLHFWAMVDGARYVALHANLWLLSLLITPFLAPQSIRRSAVAILAPVLIFVGMWVLLSDEMNYFNRFQYPAILLSILGGGAGGIASSVAIHSGRKIVLTLLVSAAAALSTAHAIAHRYEGQFSNSIVNQFAAPLLSFSEKGYVLATTEAGILPFISRWRTLDLWGLNDPWIARNGPVNEGYIDRWNPAVIIFHAPFSPKSDRKDRWNSPRWYQTVCVAEDYARTRDYDLIAAYGRSPEDAYYIFVSREVADYDSLAAVFRANRLHGVSNFAETARPATQPVSWGITGFSTNATCRAGK